MKYSERLGLWLKERFPLVNFISGAFMFFLAKSVMIDEKTSETSIIMTFLAILIPTTHLFLLRVFDEHKDFESDRINYPERVLQKGIFTLKEVRNLGIFAGSIQLVSFTVLFMVFAFNLRLLFFYLILHLWTYLMAQEFFVKDWLKRNFILYGLSHLLVTPILFILCLATINPEFLWSPSILFATILSLLTGWLYEITRKTKAPQEEKTNDKSYSQIFGLKRSTQVIFASLLITHFFIWKLFSELNLFPWIYWTIGVPLLVISALSLFQFGKAPSPVRRKKNEQTVALATLFAYLTPICFWILR